jgi:hypothetical protein
VSSGSAAPAVLSAIQAVDAAVSRPLQQLQQLHKWLVKLAAAHASVLVVQKTLEGMHQRSAAFTASQLLSAPVTKVASQLPERLAKLCQGAPPDTKARCLDIAWVGAEWACHLLLPPELYVSRAATVALTVGRVRQLQASFEIVHVAGAFADAVLGMTRARSRVDKQRVWDGFRKMPELESIRLFAANQSVAAHKDLLLYLEECRVQGEQPALEPGTQASPVACGSV